MLCVDLRQVRVPISRGSALLVSASNARAKRVLAAFQQVDPAQPRSAAPSGAAENAVTSDARVIVNVASNPNFHADRCRSGESLGARFLITRRSSMRARNVLAFALSFVLAAVALAQRSGAMKAKSAPKAAGGRLVVMASGDLKWAHPDPTGASGVQMADRWLFRDPPGGRT